MNSIARPESLFLNVLAAEAELQDDESTVFDIADLDGAAYAHLAALELPPYPFVLERTCIKVGAVAVPMVCACVDALLTSINHIGSSGLELVITQGTRVSKWRVLGAYQDETCDFLVTVYKSSNSPEVIVELQRRKEVKGRHLGPAAKKREYNAWKKKVFPAAANTAAKRHIALCSYLFRSTASGKKQKTSDTITPPPDVEVVARKAERPHIASDLQELVDTTVKTRRYECKMDHDTISALESVFGVHIPPESRADSCTFLSNALPIGNMGYTVDDLLGNGAYGIVMNATNRRGEKCVMKLTRLYDDDDDHDIEVTFKGESTEWRSVSPRDFDYGLYIHQMLDKLFEKDSLIMMPHVADALKVNIDRDGSKVGLLIMSHVSGQPLAGVFKMHNKQLSVTTAATVGAIMKRLHEHEIVHGDAHTENFLMGDDGIVYVIDFDRTTSIRGATKSVATACMDYDVVLFLKYAPVHTWRPFLDAYGRTPAYELTARSVGSVMQKLWDRYSRYLDEQMLHVNE
ncbi:kinase-like domain-containing protein [Tribonema minus]|uniref:Kinase-like domain-containing protein n=1 Tax=Tribonema minus TaxID=303371 RepID=A0A835Z4G2_9STRA|nr:kinase-like domain-containing protein [Tribonema minus]